MDKDFSQSDRLVKATVNPEDIQMLCKLVEGMGHMGVITTLDRHLGETLIQTTKDCWPELRQALESMPINVAILDEEIKDTVL